jgi:hypothetical protein
VSGTPVTLRAMTETKTLLGETRAARLACLVYAEMAGYTKWEGTELASAPGEAATDLIVDLLHILVEEGQDKFAVLAEVDRAYAEDLEGAG